MSHCAIGFPALSRHVASVTGGAWQASYPAINATRQPVEISRIARSTNASTASTTMNIVLDKARSCQMVAVVNHNLSEAAFWRVRFYAENDALLYDSGDLEVWPGIYPTSELLFEDENWWSGKANAEQRARYVANIWHRADGNYSVKTIRLDFMDPANDAGYVQIGHVEPSGWWQPTFNHTNGAELGLSSRIAVSESDSGSEYFSEQRIRREFSSAFALLPQDEALTKAFEWQREHDVSRPFFFIQDPDDVVHGPRLSFLARHKSLSGLTKAFYQRWGFPFSIREVL